MDAVNRNGTIPFPILFQAGPIIDNQAIAFTLADMRTEIDAARLLAWRAVWMAASGKTFEAWQSRRR